MVREREFDPNEALDRAMTLFWENGFSDTSMEDLVASTGVSRYGIYGTFGNKREFFIAALQRYAEQVSREYHPGLFAADAAPADIEEFMTGAIARSVETDGHRGCMICNTAVELAPDDPAIAAAVRDLFDQLAAAFATAIANGQAVGDVNPDVDPKATGELLVGVLQGALVMARTGAGKTRLTAYIDSALGILG
ncbi:MAG: TetR/AcrR family transcriptional regulator [Gammaproteobacteria bacterium]